MFTRTHFFKGLAALASLAIFSGTADAITVTVDGTTVPSLSAGVALAYAADDGPDIVNIAVNSLSGADGQILLDKPIVINGDGESGGTGDGIPCDILVDVVGIKAAANIGQQEKCYIEVQAAGAVTINDLKLHPNTTGVTGTNVSNLVDAVRFYRPLNFGEIGEYTMNRVWASGSDSTNKYIDLQTSSDLFNLPSVKLWSGQNGSLSRAVFQLTKGPDGSLGRYNATLNNCQAGLARGAALSIPAEQGTFTVNGGLYGHSGEDGIRVSGDTISLKGTATNRIRIVNVPAIPDKNGHGVEIDGGTIDLMEYVDVATTSTGWMYRLSAGAIVNELRYCRALGKLTQTTGTSFYVSGAFASNIHDITAVGAISSNDPFEINTGFNGNLNIKDSIFTSENFGQVKNNNSDLIGDLSITYSALPTDGVAGESLNMTEPFVYGTPPPTGGGNVTTSSIVSVSPQYMLKLADYDWSATQGSGNPLNGPGNANVLRPSNPAYLTASSTNNRLVGGAGPSISSIADWMLMEK